jgi:hypothetical protein
MIERKLINTEKCTVSLLRYVNTFYIQVSLICSCWLQKVSLVAESKSGSTYHHYSSMVEANSLSVEGEDFCGGRHFAFFFQLKINFGLTHSCHTHLDKIKVQF